MLSFTASGMPWSGPRGRPDSISFAAAWAAFRASSRQTSMKALSESSCASITRRADSTSATGETSPDATGPTRSAIVAVVGSEGTGSLRRPRHRDLVVGEQLLVDSSTQLPHVCPVLGQRRAVLLGHIEAAALHQVDDVHPGLGWGASRAPGRPGGR